MLRQYRLRDYRFSLILWVAAISTLGILLIGSAQQSTQQRQIWGIALGLTLMIILSFVDYTWLLNFYWFFYLAGNALLVAVLLVGENINGATRWIRIGIQFQPSDVMKIILILFFAKFFSKHEDKLNTLKIVLLSLFLAAIPLALIEAEPDLSTTIVTALTFCAIIFVAGLSYKIIGGIFLAAVPIGVVLFSIIMQPGQTLIENYQLRRILAWLRPSDYSSEAYQQTNSIIAIGSGQLYGKGLDNNMVSSVKNGNFIAEPQTDFIFAVAGEELGFLGCCLIVILELLIALECIRIGRRARDLSGTLICCGIASLIVFQSSLNICVATGLMPNTGIPLPFVSYGVTSLVSLCMGLGIVLNVGLQARKY